MTPPTELFDMRLRSLRRSRAFRTPGALFLHDRAFEDMLGRLEHVNRSFSRALLIGAVKAEWAKSLGRAADRVEAVDDATEEKLDLDPASFDLIVALGMLDTVNDLPGTLLRLRFLLRPDSLLLGAMTGGDTLPKLRHAMRAADMAMGAAAPHVHPRIEPAALAQLLLSTGLAMPVVDVDRVKVAYRDLRHLAADLRAMGATNVLRDRSKAPLTRAALEAAEEAFAVARHKERTVETFEILHFAAWSPADG